MFHEQWQTHIHTGDGFNVGLYIFLEHPSGETDVMYPTAEGMWDIRRFARGESFKPSLTFNLRHSHGIFRSLAENLATMGYSAVDSGREVKAQAAHIASLERQTERLFNLAERQPIVVKTGDR